MSAQRVAATSAALATIGLLVGCSGAEENKEYDVPKALCGVSVDQNLVSTFLPPGKKITVREKNPVPSRKRCQVNIDGEVALMVSQEWWEKRDSIAVVADAHPQLESAESTDDGLYFYSGTGGVGKVKSCVSPEHPGHVLYTAAQVYDSDRQGKAAMKKFIASYTKAVRASDVCT
ncbi:hypothetical protein ACFYP4_29665 [Streptomyces sp. NPDC005551]|uniref:hypothetical protein n=1 Tax=Streptomyces sp. NPDC005551 TaxID=3364725 RepID=UPI00367C53DD